MASNDFLRRYLEAGMAFSQVTRSRAEEIVRDLVRSGELQRNETQAWVEDLVERSKETTDAVVEMVRTEVNRQLEALGLDNPDELRRLVGSLREWVDQLPGVAAARKSAKSARKAAGSAAKAASTKRGAAGPSTARSSATTASGGAKKAAKTASGAAKKQAAASTSKVSARSTKATASMGKVRRSSGATPRKASPPRAEEPPEQAPAADH
ncbi:MAG: hypothetical protein M1115_02945 [Actinobacteria bacterium]|nr:hypothetical protein [Actinomycetota bacterium]